jgi:hypothetical protein
MSIEKNLRWSGSSACLLCPPVVVSWAVAAIRHFRLKILLFRHFIGRKATTSASEVES